MRLTDLWTGGQLKNTNTQATNGTQHVNGNTASMNRQIQALTPGQTLQGEIVSKNGNQVQIKVADDFYLDAKVDQDMNLQVGKTMTFEVRNNGQNLTLSPLFENTATQANALKALEMASLPINQNTVSMTGLMMEAGLPIDRNALQQMFRQVNAFPESPLSDVVDLHKLGLEVNQENLEQIGSYKNLTHQLVEGMHTVLDALPESMDDMMNQGNVEGAAKLFDELLNMLKELPGEGTEGLGQEAAVEAGEENPTVLSEGVVPQNGDAVAQTEGEQAQVNQAAVNGEMAGEVQEAAANAQTNALLDMVQSKFGEDPDLKPLLNQLQNAMQNGSVSEQASALQQLVEHGMQSKNQPLLETLLGHKDAQAILKDGLSKLWTIEPKDVADAGKVEELYSRLTRQLNQLSHSLEENGQNQSTAFKAVTQMNQNIDFLQQLNQAYTYVQLPLRLQQGEAHGDLYVYTNKRNLAAKDGQISALLHLDMEHLGPVDVYVAMQAEHVNTRFYVQDDEMLDFIEAHMDQLTNRLQKRGYDISFAMQVRDEKAAPNSGMKGLMAKEGAKSISQYAFDVRA